jgi:hypothetical protein
MDSVLYKLAVQLLMPLPLGLRIVGALWILNPAGAHRIGTRFLALPLPSLLSTPAAGGGQRRRAGRQNPGRA